METTRLDELQREAEALRAANRRYEALASIGRELGRHLDLTELFPPAIAQVSRALSAERSSLFIYDAGAAELWTLVGEGLDSAEIRMPVSRGIAGLAAREGQLVNIPDAYACDAFDPRWDRQTGYRTRSVLCAPMRSMQGDLLGVIQALNKRSGAPFDGGDAGFLEQIAAQMSVYVENAGLYRRLEHIFERIVNAISIAIDSRDPVTAGHSQRVTGYAVQMAKAMHRAADGPFAGVSFSRTGLRELRYACLLHDFGKVGVPEAVLQKSERLPANWMRVIEERIERIGLQRRLDARCAPAGASPSNDLAECLAFIAALNKTPCVTGEAQARLEALRGERVVTDMEYDCLSVRRGTLTPDERRVMESHVEKTRSVLAAIPWPPSMRQIPEIAATHHEALDGSGYPRGLTAAEIPLGGKMLAIADIYDALTAQDRPYKPAMPHGESVAILRGMAERRTIDGDILDLFVTKRLYRLSPGERGVNAIGLGREGRKRTDCPAVAP